MSKENLQTIIVSKSIARTRNAARKLAKPYARKIYTSRETDSSWRFRQRPEDDFVKGSFKSFPLPHESGIILVYGRLKRVKNPGSQSWIQFKGGEDQDVILREWDYYITINSKIKKSNTKDELRRLAKDIDQRDLRTSIIKSLAVKSIADRSRILKIYKLSDSVLNDEKIFNELKSDDYKSERDPRDSERLRSKNPRKNATSKRSLKSRNVRLTSPKMMPDPGPCAWLGSIVEWAWTLPKGGFSKEIDEHGNAVWGPKSEWMFMWSPRYKAIVSVKKPKNMYRLAKVSRYGGAAKMFERFMARPAENTFEFDVPNIKIQKLGKKAAHIVYRSDKWSAQRKKSDYIHPFEDGVQIYCGPNIKNPEVFLCFGGKLTLTERGLVW